MVMSKAPYRLSFFGGGTDYKAFFEEHGGSVLSTTINKYCYVTLRNCPPFFDYHTTVRYSKSEAVRKTEDIQHPLVRNCMMYMELHNLSIGHDGDLPARSGLGSSSSFAVALLHAMYAMKGEFVNSRRLAEEAIHVERVMCAESGGWQDQVAAAYGGINRIDFNGDTFKVNPVTISSERKRELESCLMMFFTGISRNSGEIAQSQEKGTRDKTAELKEMHSLVYEAEKILLSRGNINEFGRLLDYTWSLKRGLTSSITTSFIDETYKIAKDNGAIGGKLMGAGGGGFMVIFAEPNEQPQIRNALSHLVYVPFEFEQEGSKIFHYTPE